MIPITLLRTQFIDYTRTSDRLFRVLLDSGGTQTMISANALPPEVIPTEHPNQHFRTLAGNFSTARSVQLKSITFPEFSPQCTFEGITAMVFDADCPYDLIIGRDLLQACGMEISFADHSCRWFDKTIPMKTTEWKSLPLESLWSQTVEADALFFDAYADDVLVSPSPSLLDTISSQTHLTAAQRQQLQDALSSFESLFDGHLGRYPHSQIHLEVDPNVQPIHARAYSVPQALLQPFRQLLDTLLQEDVIEPCYMSRWAAASFLVAKKNGEYRFVTDFRPLNQALIRFQYPMPLIQEVITRRKGYTFFSKLDLRMMFYAFVLDAISSELCTIVTPFGKFRYKRLPMGLKISPDVAQSHMVAVLGDLDFVEVYIDDIGIFTDGPFELHIQHIVTVLTRLKDNGFKLGITKCEWAVQETDFLGYWLTPTGIKPWRKKIEAVLRMKPPQNRSQLLSFLGALNYYRNMWPRRSHLLAPLTDLTGKGTFHWTPACQQAFDTMKGIIATDVLLAYPNHNRPFDVYTDASDYQMGAAIIQDGRPVAYWSKKLNSAQMNYTTMEKELLAVVYCLQEFRSMLLGAHINVYTDHRNLTFRTLNTQRVLRWKIALEEYAPHFTYVEGKENVLADCFSRLPQMDKDPLEGKTPASNKGTLIDFEKLLTPPTSDDPTDDATDNELFLFEHIDSPTFDHLFFEALLYYPELADVACPITATNIAKHQQKDVVFQDRVTHDDAHLVMNSWNEYQIVWHREARNSPQSQWKIAIPDSLIDRVLRWYHISLGHCGINKLYDTVRTHLYFPRLKERCAAMACDNCQRNKHLGQAWGELPSKEIDGTPWEEIAVDLIGPWEVEVPGHEKITFNALTTIDTTTTLAELIRVDHKTSPHITEQFLNSWIARYPIPLRCIHDNGGEFDGFEFQQCLYNHGIKSRPSTSYNPQSNAICERLHKTVGDILRTLIHIDRPPLTLQDAKQLVDNALAVASRAMRTSVHRTLGLSPGAFAFHRDMLLNLPIFADLALIQEQRRQVLIDRNLVCQNKRRRPFNYQPGQQVLVKELNPAKMNPKATGPFRIVKIFTNGTIEIQRDEKVVERLNIRRVVPYKPPTPTLRGFP